ACWPAARGAGSVVSWWLGVVVTNDGLGAWPSRPVRSLVQPSVGSGPGVTGVQRQPGLDCGGRGAGCGGDARSRGCRCGEEPLLAERWPDVRVQRKWLTAGRLALVLAIAMPAVVAAAARTTGVAGRSGRGVAVAGPATGRPARA